MYEKWILSQSATTMCVKSNWERANHLESLRLTNTLTENFSFMLFSLGALSRKMLIFCLYAACPMRWCHTFDWACSSFILLLLNFPFEGYSSMPCTERWISLIPRIHKVYRVTVEDFSENIYQHKFRITMLMDENEDCF